MAKKGAYRKLPGRAVRSGAFAAEKCRLWLSGDRLIHLRKYWYTETCRRFNLKDIQALITCKTSKGTVINGILGSVVFILFIFAAFGFGKWTTGGWVLWWAVLAPFFLGLIANIALGPTCKTYLRTAVSMEDLPSLGRLKTARKTIGILKPLVEEKQGTLDSDTIIEKVKNETPVEEPETKPGIFFGKPDKAVVHSRGKTHEILFWLLLMDIPISALSIFYGSIMLGVLNFLWLVSAIIFAAVACSGQARTDLPAAVKKTAFTAMIYLIVMVIASWIMSYYRMISNVASMGPGNIPVNDMFSEPLGSSVVLLTFTVVTMIISSLTGLAGLSSLYRFRSEYGSPPPLPTTGHE